MPQRGTTYAETIEELERRVEELETVMRAAIEELENRCEDDALLMLRVALAKSES